MIHTEIRTTLARLELCSSASCQAFDPNGGAHETEHPGGKRPPGPESTAAEWYRRRLHALDAGHPRRVNNKHDVKVRDSYEHLLSDARSELQAITGRTDTAPRARISQLDTEQGLEHAIREDAPGEPADEVAGRLNVSIFIVRRVYVELGLDPHDGLPIGDGGSLREQALDMGERRFTVRQISMYLKVPKSTVHDWLRRQAA